MHTIVFAKRERVFTWSSDSAVPSAATVLVKPASCIEMTSMYPSDTMAYPFAAMLSLA